MSDWIKRNANWIWKVVASAAISAILILLVDIRDHVKYKQPHIDEIQTSRIKNIEEKQSVIEEQFDIFCDYQYKFNEKIKARLDLIKMKDGNEDN